MEKSSIFGQNLYIGTGTESGYQYPWTKAKWYRYRSSGTGTHSQKRVGTGTDQSGTDIDASNSPDFCTLALLSPNLYTDSMGTLIKY